MTAGLPKLEYRAIAAISAADDHLDEIFRIFDAMSSNINSSLKLAEHIERRSGDPESRRIARDIIKKLSMIVGDNK